MAKLGGLTSFVTAESLLGFLEHVGISSSPSYMKDADICENKELLAILEEFRGSDCSEAVKTKLVNMLSKIQSAALVVEDELLSMEVLLKMSQRGNIMSQFFAANPPDIDVPAIQQKIGSCNRLLRAIQQSRNCLEKAYVVTLLTREECGCTVVVCLNMAGEELLPAQSIDVTYGKLLSAVQATAPDAYIQLATTNGVKLNEDFPDNELVKDMLE